jgi:hypothetical protein
VRAVLSLVSRSEHKWCCLLKFAGGVAGVDLAARHREFLHRCALFEAEVGEGNAKGIGAGGRAEIKDHTLLVVGGAPKGGGEVGLSG